MKCGPTKGLRHLALRAFHPPLGTDLAGNWAPRPHTGLGKSCVGEDLCWESRRWRVLRCAGVPRPSGPLEEELGQR